MSALKIAWQLMVEFRGLLAMGALYRLGAGWSWHPSSIQHNAVVDKLCFQDQATRTGTTAVHVRALVIM